MTSAVELMHVLKASPYPSVPTWSAPEYAHYYVDDSTAFTDRCDHCGDVAPYTVEVDGATFHSCSACVYGYVSAADDQAGVGIEYPLWVPDAAAAVRERHLRWLRTRGAQMRAFAARQPARQLRLPL